MWQVRFAKLSRTSQSIPILDVQAENLGTRELVIAGTRYVVPYRVKGDRLAILAVLHGAQRRNVM